MKKKLAILVFVFCCVFLGTLATLPAFFPGFSSKIADGIRSVAGPEFVAGMEEVSFSIQDSFREISAPFRNNEPEISVEKLPVVHLETVPQVATETPTATSVPTIATVKPIETLEVFNVVTDSPQIGWTQYGSEVKGEPVMAQTLLENDPERPYAAIVVVRMDMSKLDLHMVPGFLEPSSSAEVQKAFPNLGEIPEADLGRLVAAFNGGFKAVNGQFGMMVDGTVLLPPKEGLETIVQYDDGSIKILLWTNDMTLDNIVSLRQNCPPILTNGQISDQVYLDDRRIWGQTIENTSITWRTGLGLSQDGRYLIYAVGNATSVETLAKALQTAGAYNAMQIDINRHYARFVTFKSDDSGKTVAAKLLAQMEDDPTIFLVPRSRDFFYITFK